MKSKNEKLTIESSLEEQQAAVLDSLVSYQPHWAAQRFRTNRAAGLDAQLNASWELVNGRMNDLLERYFCLTAGVELGHVPTEDEVLADVRRLEEEVAWSEYGQD